MGGCDEKFMLEALKLAEKGIGSVEPNPAVGCVIVKADRVIGKGCHKKYGGPHAEINAIENCKRAGVDPAGAAMYVTLEPCCHYGKTPACTDAIIAAGIGRVVVATIDPSQHAGGKGIRILQNAGIEVQTGVCESQARLLNAPFMKFAAAGRTWVTLKWAQSLDGKLGYADNDTKKRWISNELSRKDAHKRRRRVQAILVGINTVLADDPLLTARPARQPPPLRIVLDSRLRIPLDCQLVKTASKAPVLIYTRQDSLEASPEKAEAIRQSGIEILSSGDTGERSNLHFLLEQLAKRGIQQLLVEGGSKVIASFLNENLADEIVVYIAPNIVGTHASVGISESMAAVGLHHVDIKRFGDDIRLTGFLESPVC